MNRKVEGVLTTYQGAATNAAVEKLRQSGVIAFAGTASNGPDAGVWIVLDAKDPTIAREQLDNAGGDVSWLLRPRYGSVHHGKLPRLAKRRVPYRRH